MHVLVKTEERVDSLDSAINITGIKTTKLVLFHIK